MLLTLVMASLPASALQLRQAHHSPLIFDPAKGERVTIRFHITESAAVDILIYDGRDWLVRTLSAKDPLPAGDNTIQWDGRDSNGKTVPPEAYRYVLSARGSQGKTVVHDVTDFGGEELIPHKVSWDLKAGKIEYILTRAGRVRIRVGIKDGGPLLHTPLVWVPRLAGKNLETWDGKDADDVLDLSQHPNLDIDVRAYALSENTVIVGPLSDNINLIQDLSSENARVKKRQPKKTMFDYAQQPIETRREVTLVMTLPKSLKTSAEGLPVLDGKVPVRVNVAEDQLATILARRFELVMFLDGQFAYEAEEGFLPATWNLNTQPINPGVHYLTANLRGYEGNFGIKTLKVLVSHDQNKQ
jgi:hypothetical protein